MNEKLSKALYELAKQDETILNNIKVAENNPNDSKTWRKLGNVLAQRNYFEVAIKCYDESLNINPNYVHVWSDRGKAIRSYDKAIEIEPSYVDAWYYKAIVFYNLGYYEEAIRSYDKAIEIDPSY